MVDTQHFCLRWNNYQSSITSAFENLRDDEDFVDVTLACDGRSLKAHRVVLSACSPYFRELLKVSLHEFKRRLVATKKCETHLRRNESIFRSFSLHFVSFLFYLCAFYLVHRNEHN